MQHTHRGRDGRMRLPQGRNTGAKEPGVMEDGMSKGLFRLMLLLSAHILEKPRYIFLLAFSELS